jgi:hypothetical protein
VPYQQNETYVYYLDTLALTTLLTLTYKRLGYKVIPIKAFSPVLMAIFDIIENAAQMYTVLVFHERKSLDLKNWTFAAITGSLVNQLKWLSCALISVLLVFLVKQMLTLKSKKNKKKSQ